MQVVVLQSAGEHAANAHFREALSLARAFDSLGCAAFVVGPGHREDRARVLDADLVVVLENYWRQPWLNFIRSEVVERGVRCAYWSIDAHVPAAAARQAQLVTEQRIPVVFCSTANTQSIFARDGARTVWLPNAVDTSLVKPSSDKQHDAGFCGRLIAGRAAWLEAVRRDTGINVRIDEWVLGEAMVSAVSGYRVGLNRAYNIDINYRCFETCACRTALLTNDVPNIRELLVPGEHCELYRSTAECGAKLVAMLRNPDRVELMARRGYDHVVANHTYVHRARTIMEVMG